MSPRHEAHDDLRGKPIGALLSSLVLLDVTLTIWAFFFPRLWFAAFHGVPYDDPQGFLKRCAANWAAFALFQLVAWRRWRKQPDWLVVVAGLRLSDIFTDWTYLFSAHDITWFGRVALFAVSPANLAIGWYLLRTYRAMPRAATPA